MQEMKKSMMVELSRELMCKQTEKNKVPAGN